MNIDDPTNRKFVVCRSEDGSVLHRVTIGPDQSMATGQPVVEQTESEIEHLNHLAPFADKLPPLPAEGEPVDAGEVYAHEGSAVMARKDHTRGSHRPADVADLFITTGTRDDVLEGLGRIEDVAVDINTATAEELETLDGVGPSLAQKIIDGRPYDSVDDLTRVSGVSQSMVDGWRDGVVA